MPRATFSAITGSMPTVHTIEMALRYEINCPECNSGRLKQVGRCLNSHELGLYICPVCEKRKSSY